MSSNGHVFDEVVSSAFGIDATAKVTGFSTRQLARWDREGWYSPAFGDPSRREIYGRVYSYADLVRLRTAWALLDRGVPVRRALAAVTEPTPSDWREVPATPLYVFDRTVSTDQNDVAVRNGQIETVDPEVIVAEVNGGVRQLAIRTPEQIGATERRRGWVNGEEVFAGTRIPVTTIIGLIEDGWPRSEILANYERLRNADLDLAEARLRDGRALAS